MPINNFQAESLIAEIELLRGKRFSHKDVIENIVKISCDNETIGIFNRLIFLAKFLHNTHRMMNRIGKEGEGYKKLLSEFIGNANEAIGILKKIADVTSEEFRNELQLFMNIQTKTDLENFLKLMEDLSWLKNFELDSNCKICEDLI